MWKVGFSGEHEPRKVFWAEEGGEAWDLDLRAMQGGRSNREEGRRIVEGNVLKKSREAYIKYVSRLHANTSMTLTCRYLLTDAKTRKVIVLENTFLPTHVKEAIAQALFDNLRVGHTRGFVNAAYPSYGRFRQSHSPLRACWLWLLVGASPVSWWIAAGSRPPSHL